MCTSAIPTASPWQQQGAKPYTGSAPAVRAMAMGVLQRKGVDQPSAPGTVTTPGQEDWN